MSGKEADADGSKEEVYVACNIQAEGSIVAGATQEVLCGG